MSNGLNIFALIQFAGAIGIAISAWGKNAFSDGALQISELAGLDEAFSIPLNEYLPKPEGQRFNVDIRLQGDADDIEADFVFPLWSTALLVGQVYFGLSAWQQRALEDDLVSEAEAKDLEPILTNAINHVTERPDGVQFIVTITLEDE